MDLATQDLSTVAADWPIKIVIPVSLMIVLIPLIVIAVACISYLIYKRRQSTSLSNLTKPHKESEENSYASSEHSRESSSKQSDTPDPGYDVIKMEHLKDVALKSAQLGSNSEFELSRKDIPLKDEYLNGDPFYCTVYSNNDDQNKSISSDIHSSSSDVHHKRESNNVSYLSADNRSNNSSNESKGDIKEAEVDDETNEPHTYSVVLNRKREQENKAPQDENEALPTLVQKHTFSSYDEAPSIPPHTVEMMYTAVQKRPKDSVEIEDEGDAPPIPPYTGEEYHTSGT